ncbi:YWFCY domain-containing protein [Pedobacter endophyticus]
MALGLGLVLFFLNAPLLRLSQATGTFLYILNVSLCYLALLTAGVWMSRVLRTNLMINVLNNEN